MFPGLVLPLIAAVAAAVVVTMVHRRLPPMLAARALTTALVVTAAAAAPTLWIVALDYVAHVQIFGGRLAWCTMPLMSGQRISIWIGVPAVVLTAAGVVGVVKTLRSHHRLRHDQPGPVEVADHLEPFAVTLPGRAGHVLVSRGLIELLDADEHAVVLAHEHAHASHRHDRYMLTARLATVMVPVLRPLSTRLHFCLERWADESAVVACGDRRFVARTLGKVALSSTAPVGALGFSGLGVPARVAALLGPPPVAPRRSRRIGLWSVIAMTGALGVIQIHHLLGVVSALCLG